jgi:diguanylate cyclase (GGDEF)-like protein
MSEDKFPSVAATTLFAVIGAFALGIVEIDAGLRIVGFAFIAIAAVALTYFQMRAGNSSGEVDPAMTDLHDELLMIFGEDEIAVASSLSIPDAFRLLVARLRSVTTFRGSALWLPVGKGDEIAVHEAEGDHRSVFAERRSSLGNGLAGRAWENGRVETGYEGNEQLPSVAIPICRGPDVIGILQFVYEPSYDLARIDRTVFDAIASGAGPVLSASLAFEKNSSNALVDELTGIPNERAFFLVLEQHVAESQRRGADRPITVLAVNVRDFDSVVLAYGGAAGDRVLAAVAGILKDLLRSMDTITRASGDEFLVVLPMTTREIALEIVARIHSVFYTRRIEVADSEKLEIRLNIGVAHFGDDGDTPATLLQSARRSRDSRRDLPPVRILDFPNDLSV